MASTDFLFISYAHADMDSVLPDVSFLEQNGNAVWFDREIQGGVMWRDTIARQISNSLFVVAYVSRNWLASDYCQQEVSFALDEGKPVLCIHLESTQLPPGLKLSLNRRQALMRYLIPREQFLQKFDAAIRSNLDASALSVGGGATQMVPHSLILEYQSTPYTIPAGFGGLFTIGRSSQCQLTLDTQFASRFHGTIRSTKKTFLYEDDSSNGTVMISPDGETLVHKKSIEMPHQGELRINDVSLRFRHSGEEDLS